MLLRARFNKLEAEELPSASFNGPQRRLIGQRRRGPTSPKFLIRHRAPTLVGLTYDSLPYPLVTHELPQAPLLSLFTFLPYTQAHLLYTTLHLPS